MMRCKHLVNFCSSSGAGKKHLDHSTCLIMIQVILLGLYNGQRLDAEPSRDIVTYARSVEVVADKCNSVLALANMTTRRC